MHVNDLIRHCIRLAEDDPEIEVLWLYGSRAKGNAGPDSDYDFAVAFHSFPSDELTRGLRAGELALQWVSRLDVPDSLISVVDINHVPLPLAYNVVATGRALFVRNPLRRIREENRITSMWDLDWQYHKKHYG